MSRTWLHLDLSAPLMAFGAVAVDQVGPTHDFPTASGLTGLLANALGWDWTDAAKHDALQARLVYAAVIARQGTVLTDMQNAKLEKNDKGWTTQGSPEGRDGGSGTYLAPHRRRRDYLADHSCHVVLSLDPADQIPDIDTLAGALERPARPLFIGRKPCLPSGRILTGRVTADSARAAFEMLGFGGRALWQGDERVPEGAEIHERRDLRNWRNGYHAGSRNVIMGTLP